MLDTMRTKPMPGRYDVPSARKRSSLLILILLLGFSLRLVRLDAREMWYDEAFAVLYAEKDLGSIVQGTVTPVEGAAADIHPLLYYFFLHGWMRIGQSPFVVRFPSVAFGVLSVCLVYLLGRELFGVQIGLLASVLTALSPFHIWYSQEARMYSLLCLISLLSIYFFAKAYQDGKWRHWMAFAFCSALSLYVHNLAFLIPFTLIVFALATRRWTLFPRLLAAYGVILLLFLPWLILVPGQFAKVQQAYWVAKPGLSELVRTLLVFTFNLPIPNWLLPLVLFYSILLLTLTLYLALRPSIRQAASGSAWAMGLVLSLFLVPVLTMFIISQFKSVYIERAVLVGALAYYIAMAFSFLKSRPPRLILLSLLPVPLLLAISLEYQYTYSLFPRSPFRDANAYLREHRQDGDAIVHDSKLSFFPSHYYDRSLPQEYIGDVPGSSTDTLALPTQEVLGLLAQPDVSHAVGNSRRVWFVVFQRALDEATELGVENESKAWLDSRYSLTSVEAFNDLLVYLYEAP
jgi:mannosyltransferase